MCISKMNEFKVHYLLHGGVPERGHTLTVSILLFNVFSNFFLETLEKLISLTRTRLTKTYHYTLWHFITVLQDFTGSCWQEDPVLLLRCTYQTLKDENHHSSCYLDEEDNQHNTEELKGEKIDKLCVNIWLIAALCLIKSVRNRLGPRTFKQS